jgi:hypothetical protein
VAKRSVISVDGIKELNRSLTQPQYHSILREAYPYAPGSCAEMVYDGHGGWIGIGWFRDKPSKEACLKYCEREKVLTQYCPCNKLFSGE